MACQEHRYIFGAIGHRDDSLACPIHGIVKFDVQERSTDAWAPEPHEFAGEVRILPSTRTDGKDSILLLGELFFVSLSLVQTLMVDGAPEAIIVQLPD